ncbi:Rha family transcriptional regulator [Oceanirhabdus sp. W0125-5]|uniref:Rha family transcriptional regulator n=1 Tax=Oceanirhabdus sp. W0125-5 TaxID=2999116 RepID=UPI0022F345FC|nr:Rha family transcriptional regulator [Oceanirhabdus sp. W0125-5]WBW95276.1 ORF6C domain-containing protein [Oceanirhabdus sp. W0125-5]
MKELINVVEENGKLIVGSREVSLNFEKRHGHVIEKIDGIIEGINSTEKSVQYFIPHEYKDLSGKLNKEYLLTRDGFSLLVMGFTGNKALDWKMKYIQAFNKMEEKIRSQKQLSPMDQLKLQYEVLEQHDNKLNDLDGKVRHIENNMVIDYGQEVTIKKEVDCRVKKVCYGKEFPAYLDKTLRAKVYRALWRDYKGYFNITSYHNTLKKDFQTSLNLIRKWSPNGELLRLIEKANNQLVFSDVGATKED